MVPRAGERRDTGKRKQKTSASRQEDPAHAHGQRQDRKGRDTVYGERIGAGPRGLGAESPRPAGRGRAKGAGGGGSVMASGRGASSRWFFTREQLENTPSRRCGVEADEELSHRQQAANLIQDMGQRLNVSQLTINTAIVYMHRFYMHHSFTKFNRNIISPTALFLAAKVEEQARKLEHVIKVAHACLHPLEPLLDTKCDAYLQQTQELVLLETIMLQTLGFEITIEHPHTDVVKCTQLVRGEWSLGHLG